MCSPCPRKHRHPPWSAAACCRFTEATCRREEYPTHSRPSPAYPSGHNTPMHLTGPAGMMVEGQRSVPCRPGTVRPLYSHPCHIGGRHGVQCTPLASSRLLLRSSLHLSHNEHRSGHRAGHAAGCKAKEAEALPISDWRRCSRIGRRIDGCCRCRRSGDESQECDGGSTRYRAVESC